MQGNNQLPLVCSNCNELMLKPAVMSCNHAFCSFCLYSLRYQNGTQDIECPTCSNSCNYIHLDTQREQAIIQQIITMPNVRVFWGHAKTTSDYDQSVSKTHGFFYVLKEDRLFGDIVWTYG